MHIAKTQHHSGKDIRYVPIGDIRPYLEAAFEEAAPGTDGLSHAPANPTSVDPEEYVWMPEYPNRTTAINTARRIFNHILEKADLVDPERKLHPYSLRHYALQARLRGSQGKVNIHTLAQNAGTSVDQLERFYLKRMAPTPEMIENLHTTGEASVKRDKSPKDDHLSFVEEDDFEG